MPSSIPETRPIGETQFAAMNMHPAVLGTARERRHALLRIQETVWVKGTLEGAEEIQLGAGELHAHLIDLLYAHAMLAGNGPAHLYTELQDGSAEFLGALDLVGLVRIEHDERVQIAVAGMKDI